MDEDRVQRLAEPTDGGVPFGRQRHDDRDAWSGGGSARDGGTNRPQGRGALRGPEPLDQRLERWVNRGLDLVDGVSGARPGGRFSGIRSRDTAGGIGGGLGSRTGDAPGGAGQLRQGRSDGASAVFRPGRLGRWVEERLDWLLDEDGEDDWREPWQEPSARPAATGPLPWGSAPRAAAAGDGSGGWRELRPERLSRPAAAEPAAAPLAGAAWEANRAAVPSMGPSRRGLEAISRRGSSGGSAAPVNPVAGWGAAGSMSASGRPPAAPPMPPQDRMPSAAPPAEPNSGESRPDHDDWPDEASFSVTRWRRPPAERPADPLARPEAPPPDGGRDQGGGRPLPRSSRRR
jgi:hypothetical protein